MGIQVEFNPDLALRKHGTPDRLAQECLPEKLEVGRVYEFLKRGQRNYWLDGEIPLVETTGNGNLSRPIASILIMKVVHERTEKQGIMTRGKYIVNEVYDPKDPTIHFEGMNKVGERKQ